MTIAEPMTQASNEELIEHILTRYHDTHREQLPELIQLSERVERVHGGHTDRERSVVQPHRRQELRGNTPGGVSDSTG